MAARSETESRHSSDAGLLATLVELASTGPLALGTFTTAQVLAVNGPAPGLPVPEPEVLAEAVRDLVARGLAVPVPGSDEIDVRGDLGILLTLQRRSRLLVDVMLRGRSKDESAHIVLLPQAEGVTLYSSIDALGLHHLTMYPTSDAVARLDKELPHGRPAEARDDRPVETQIERADEAALISVVRFSDVQPESSVDVVLLRSGDRLRALRRDGADAQEWSEAPLGAGSGMDLVAQLAGPLLAAPKDG
jgi:hypothetical protein